jgi:hypothetical protein
MLKVKRYMISYRRFGEKGRVQTRISLEYPSNMLNSVVLISFSKQMLLVHKFRLALAASSVSLRNIIGRICLQQS